MKMEMTTILHHAHIFARHRIPTEVISDNGPEFSSHEFSSFAKQWDFTHITSSPRYLQSNGRVERTIQTVKTMLQKVAESGQDVYLALLALRTATLKEIGESPSYLLMKRNPRSLLPSIVFQDKETQCSYETSCDKAKNYNLNSKDLMPLLPEETVRIRQNSNWSQKGKVIQKSTQPRSYDVITDKGTVLRRNRHHLLKTRESSTTQPEMDYENISVPSRDVVQPLSNASSQSMSQLPSLSPPKEQEQGPPERDSSPIQGYRTRYGQVVKQLERFQS